MAVRYSNNVSTTLASGLPATATTMSVVDGSGLPTLSGGDHTYVTVERADGTREVVRVTAISGNTLTIVRGQDGTIAETFSAGDSVQLRMCAALLADAVGEKLDRSGGTMTGAIVSEHGASASWGNALLGALHKSLPDNTSADWVVTWRQEHDPAGWGGIQVLNRGSTFRIWGSTLNDYIQLSGNNLQVSGFRVFDENHLPQANEVTPGTFQSGLYSFSGSFGNALRVIREGFGTSAIRFDDDSGRRGLIGFDAAGGLVVADPNATAVVQFNSSGTMTNGAIPASHVTPGTFTLGTYVFNTNTANDPVRISRTGGADQAVDIGVNDTQARFDYSNDEDAGSIIFTITNTDTEGSDGSLANYVSLQLYSDPSVQRLDWGGNVIRVGGVDLIDRLPQLEVANAQGYVRLGPQNDSWAHFITDRPNFYFNTGVSVAGDLWRYQGGGNLGTAADPWSNLHTAAAHIGTATYRNYGSGDTDITGLVPGSNFGALADAPESGHFVIGIRANEGNDGFHVLSTTTTAPGGDFTSSLLTVTGNLFRYKTFDVFHTGHTPTPSELGAGSSYADRTYTGGLVTFENNIFGEQLRVRRGSANSAVVRYDNTGGQLGLIGFDPGGHFTVWDDANVVRWQVNKWGTLISGSVPGDHVSGTVSRANIDGNINRWEGITGLSADGDGWFTIAEGSDRRFGEFVLMDGSSGRHNVVRFNVTYAYGQATITVLSGDRFSTATLADLRVLRPDNDPTYGVAKVQVRIANVGGSWTVRQASHGHSSFANWALTGPTKEDPAGYSNVANIPSPTSHGFGTSDTAHIGQDLLLGGDIYHTDQTSGTHTFYGHTVRLGRHLDAHKDWSGKGSTLFLGWSTDHYILGGQGVSASDLDGYLGVIKGPVRFRGAADFRDGRVSIIGQEVLIDNGNGSDTWFNHNNGSNNYIRGGFTQFDSRVDLNVGVRDELNFTASTSEDLRGVAFNGRIALSADSSDGWLRLNGASEFGNGVYSPGRIRSDSQFCIGSTSYGIRLTQANYGTFSIFGEYVGGYCGISLADRLNFMENGSGTGGLYWDNTNEWAILTANNGRVELYYNGSSRLLTTAAGAKVNGDLEITGSITGAGAPTSGSKIVAHTHTNVAYAYSSSWATARSLSYSVTSGKTYIVEVTGMLRRHDTDGAGFFRARTYHVGTAFGGTTYWEYDTAGNDQYHTTYFEANQSLSYVQRRVITASSSGSVTIYFQLSAYSGGYMAAENPCITITEI